jgi:2-alkyl-3-oxoalkanoate reductase
MRVLFTGASSVLGSRVLRRMLEKGGDCEIWCTRHQTELPTSDPPLHVIDLDLETDFDLQSLPAPLDLVVHFAAVTHARDPDRYWKVNLRGTRHLAEAVRARGCQRFVYVSTRCATAGAGAYGESKLAAEVELKKLSWQSLLIIRPAEVYAGGGREGIDRLMGLGQGSHVVPMLFGHENIRFAPLHIDDFVEVTSKLILAPREGLFEAELCGPEDLSGAALAWRIARRFVALPVPLWWPLLKFSLRVGGSLGLNPLAPDQIERLVSEKTAPVRRASDRQLIRFLN